MSTHKFARPMRNDDGFTVVKEDLTINSEEKDQSSNFLFTILSS